MAEYTARRSRNHVVLFAFAVWYGRDSEAGLEMVVLRGVKTP